MAHKKGHKSKRPKSTRPPSKSSERIARLGVRAATSKREDDDFVPSVRKEGTEPVGKKIGKVYDNQAKKRFAANKAAKKAAPASPSNKPMGQVPAAVKNLAKKQQPKPDVDNYSAMPKAKGGRGTVVEAPGARAKANKPKGASPSGIAQVGVSKPAPTKPKKALPQAEDIAQVSTGQKERDWGEAWKAVGRVFRPLNPANKARKSTTTQYDSTMTKAAGSKKRAAAKPTKNPHEGIGTTPKKVDSAKSQGAKASTPKPTPTKAAPPKAPAPMNSKTSGGKKKVPTGVGYDRMGPSARSASKPTQYKDNAKASRSAASVNLNTGSIEDKFGAAMSKIFGSYEAASGVEGTDSYKTKKYNKGKRTK